MIGEYYYLFSEEATNKIINDNLDKDAWEVVREYDKRFGWEGNDREQYIKYCEASKSICYDNVIEIASIINSRAESGISNICSVGAGTGLAEYWLSEIVRGIKICLTDVTNNVLSRLRNISVFDDVKYFDLLNGDAHDLLGYDFILMYRISTEFSDIQWRDIFYRFYLAGIKDVIYVPTEFATSDLIELKRIEHEENIKRGLRDIFCGWLYTEDEICSFFSPYYDIISLKKRGTNGVFHLRLGGFKP